MHYVLKRQTIIGEIAVITDDESVTDLLLPQCCREFYKNPESVFKEKIIWNESPVMKAVDSWLAGYFNVRERKENEIDRQEIEINFGLKPYGTEFQRLVWEETSKIPFGSIKTYGDIANIIAKRRGIRKMSAQAVGQALNKNPIPIIIPCHRVLGVNNKITGYGGGIDIKKILLDHEKIEYRY